MLKKSNEYLRTPKDENIHNTDIIRPSIYGYFQGYIDVALGIGENRQKRQILA